LRRRIKDGQNGCKGCQSMSRARGTAHPPRRATAATPIAWVRALLLAFARYGQDPAEVLRQGQIPPALLDDPEARITARQMEIVSEGAMRQLDDEALGWFSRRLPWGTLGMLCRASLPSPDLGVALKRWFRHHRLLTEEIELTLQVADGRATVSVVERRDLGAVREFCLVSYLRYVHGYASWVVDSRISLLEVSFPFPRPPYADVFPLIFPVAASVGPAGGAIAFDAPRASYAFDARYLALPPRRDDAALRAMLKRALPLTVLAYRRDRLLAQRVRRLLSEHPAERHGADAVARRLHLSPRSLHRHLAEEGTSLQALKDEVRRARAMDLLARTDRPVKEIAGAVGFADEKSFSRAFRGWTGKSPVAFRRSA
jgi:AraC-like DNA-binding protein